MNKCCECQKQFGRLSVLRRHVKQFHSDKLEQIAPLKRQQKQYKFTCDCGKNFSYFKHFNAHKKTHGSNSLSVEEPLKKVLLKKCPLCTYENEVESELHTHFETVHDTAIVVKKLEFPAWNEFELWKTSFEKASRSKYVKKRGILVKKLFKEISYYCQRSGTFTSGSKGLRRLKKQGSVKINGFCPAKIKVALHENGKCVVTVVETHVGHTEEEEVRDNLTSESLIGPDFLTAEDLHNIETSFKLESTAVKQQDNRISFEAWINEMREGNVVLFYKPQDTLLPEHPALKTADFVLCIMNDNQSHVLKKLGNECICIDRTHGLKKFQFKIHTLLVLDDLRQSFPVAFLISNRSNEAVLKLFFQVIKDRSGVTFKPKVFMSDVTETYYNAWTKIMDKADRRLFCTWHVVRAWNRNLSLIWSKDKQQKVRSQLMKLLQETDSVAFDTLIKNFVAQTSDDPDTLTFSNYFKDNYFRNSTCWAYCYRLQSGLNTNMNLERIHKTIKYIHFEGENGKRLDRTISCLMTFVRDKIYDRVVTLHKNKIGSKLADLETRHKIGVELTSKICKKDGNSWEMQSSKSLDCWYSVQKRSSYCNCLLSCRDCNSCLHRFTCNCVDSAVKWNMCKHIHLLCSYLTKKRSRASETTEIDDDQNNLLIDSVSKHVESQNVVETLTLGAANDTQKKKSVEERKEKMRRHFNKILGEVHTESEIETLERLVAPIGVKDSAVSQSSNIALETTAKTFTIIPLNEIVVLNRKFVYILPKEGQTNSECLSEADKNT